MLRFWFDRGIRVFGVYVTNAVDAAGKAASNGVKNSSNKVALENGARQRTLAKLLGKDLANSTTGYRDPGKRVGR